MQNIFRRISLAVRGDSNNKEKHDNFHSNAWGRPEPKPKPTDYPDWQDNRWGQWSNSNPPPQPTSPGTLPPRGWGTGTITSPWHDHSHYSNGDHYAQCAEVWDKSNSRWMTFDPKDIAPRPSISYSEQHVYFCVTSRYNDYWSEPHPVLTHFSEPLSSFVNRICGSFGTWGDLDNRNQYGTIELGQAFRTLKITKAKLAEIEKAVEKGSGKTFQDKLDLVKSVGNMAVDARTPEDDLNKYLKNLKKQLKVFIAYLEKKFKPIADRLASAARYDYMEFDLLPYYFEPGQEVSYTTYGSHGHSLAMKIEQVHVQSDLSFSPGAVRGVNQITIEGRGYAWDGIHFSRVNLKTSCYTFAGSQELSKLPVQLLTPEKRAELTARGRRYKAEAGIHYRICKGERVVIDRLGFLDAEIQESSNRRKKANKRIQRRDSYDYHDHYPQPDLQSGPLPVSEDISWSPDAGKAPTPVGPSPKASSDSASSTPNGQAWGNWNRGDIADDLLCFLPVDLYGYNLNKKEWQSFDLDAVKPIEFDSKAWDHLVLDADVKTLIKGLVEVSTKSTVASGVLVNDVIARKGGGLTSVLYGPPGTGKTLTAEAVAELLRRPLLTVGSSDLPREPSGMEDTLRYVLKLATTWDAVLLIDEADVFLEQRSLHEIERNALVSVALRVLEYHRGVVFLTTNRIKVFDEAFLSRFSIAVKYPELNKSGRYLIWSRFLELAGYKIVSSPFVTNDDLGEKIIPRQSVEALAAKHFNGRTIKNLVRTAQALALSSNSPLKMEHINIVVRAQEKFLEDFAVERSLSA